MYRSHLKNVFTTLILSVGSQVATAADGEINFSGSVTDNTCSIEVKDPNGSAGNVSLGEVPAISLKTVGDVAGGGVFFLTIAGSEPSCDLEGKKAVVKFLPLSGTAGADGQWIGITKDEGHAENVAVQIKDATGKDVQLGLESAPYADLTQPLRFTANYIATGIATSGPANAKAAFTVEYQ